MFCSVGLYSQMEKQVHPFRNVVSYEFAGNTAMGFNLNYHRLWPTKEYPWLCANSRAGIGVVKSNANAVIGYCTLEVCAMFGSRAPKFEIGFGFVPQFGSQNIAVFDHWYQTPTEDIAVTKTITVNYYDRVTFRLGLVLIPQSSHFLFFRAAWTPYYIPRHNPAPYGYRLIWENREEKRVFLGWGGLSIGFSF